MGFPWARPRAPMGFPWARPRAPMRFSWARPRAPMGFPRARPWDFRGRGLALTACECAHGRHASFRMGEMRFEWNAPVFALRPWDFHGPSVSHSPKLNYALGATPPFSMTDTPVFALRPWDFHGPPVSLILVMRNVPTKYLRYKFLVPWPQCGGWGEGRIRVLKTCVCANVQVFILVMRNVPSKASGKRSMPSSCVLGASAPGEAPRSLARSWRMGGGTNPCDAGLDLSGSWQQGHSAAYNAPSRI